MTFEQAAFSFGWDELVNFSNHLPLDSATNRASQPDEYNFATDLQRSVILADVYDAISGIAYMFATRYGGKPQKPQPYPRPWTNGGAQKIGSEPIPISEFKDWYYGGD